MTNTTAIEIINLLCDKLGLVVDWTGENILPYIQSLLEEVAVGKYNLHFTLSVIFGSIFCLGLLFLLIGVFSKGNFDTESYEVLGFLLMFIGFIGTAIAVCLTVEWKTMPTVMGYKWLNTLLNNS